MIKSIIQHELRLAFYNRKTWFCLAAIHALLGIIFNWLMTSFLKNQASLPSLKYGITEEVIHPYYAWFALIVLLFIPMLTTQAICAERPAKTLINYCCAPISAMQFVLAKFFALSVMLLLMVIFISLLPLSVIISGSLDWGQYLASIFGVYLMLNVALAIGLVFSSFMHSVTRANITVFLSLITFVLLEWAAQYTGKQAMFLQNFGLLNPLKNFMAGIISVQGTSYYLLVIGCALIISKRLFSRGAPNV